MMTPPPGSYVRDGVVYTIHETNAYVGELGRRWFRWRAQRLANESNAARLAPSLRYELRQVGTFRYAVVALQNQLLPPGAVPDAGRLPRSVLNGAEDVIEADLGLPPTWRCACGGKPFVGKRCPRCGAIEP
jgi:hypothetical protein